MELMGPALTAMEGSLMKSYRTVSCVITVPYLEEGSDYCAGVSTRGVAAGILLF